MGRVELISGRMGHREGISNNFSTYPLVIERTEASQTLRVPCQSCAKEVIVNVRGFKSLMFWRVAAGIGALVGIAGVVLIAKFGLTVPGLVMVAVAAATGLGAYLTLQGNAVSLPYADHAFFIEKCEMKK